MNLVQVLDCTLRDGGYCNQWDFGFHNACKITSGLVEANIDIIECGFLTNRMAYQPNMTKFTSIEQISAVIPQNRNNKLFLVMINYGEYDAEDLPDWDGSSVDGIRVAFHKKDMQNALAFCEKVREKGYKVFIQAMVSLCYSDDEFLDLIRRVNRLKPYAFYIVDSFGMMKNKDLIRLFYMVEHNLESDIWIGFHSHNNMQLAYSNAQKLIAVQTNRNLIVDSSVYGMGRGAGNLNTELFVDYLNETEGKNYRIKPLLNMIDEILNDFYQKHSWGYSLSNYLSAAHQAHPDYARYLDNKKTMTIESMNELFGLMAEDKKNSFDKNYIEELYLRYMETGRVQEKHLAELELRLRGTKVVLIAPGKSSADEKEKILAFLEQQKVVSIGVNADYPYADCDYIFLSNLRRFRELGSEKREKCIVTSNIPADGVYLQTKYSDLVNGEEAVHDNAGLMAIKFLQKMEVSQIYLAGFDGYSHDPKENYANKQLAYSIKSAVQDAMNIGMNKVLSQYKNHIDIVYLTTPRHVKI